MNIVFAGGAEISIPTLQVLAQEHSISAVLTHPETVAGRGRKKKVNPVKETAVSLGLVCIEAEELKGEIFDVIKKSRPELLAVVAYGKLFPEEFLRLFPRGAVNMHPSLLPKYRGPSPVTAAILNGDDETGITVQYMERKMDAGDIILQERFPLGGNETTGSLLRKLAEPGARLMARAVREIEAGTAARVKQDEEEATYCRLIAKEDGKIDWKKPADVIEREVRAYTPWPRGYTFFNDKKLFILEASVTEITLPDGGGPGNVSGIDKKEGILIQTGNGILAVTRLQLEAKKAMDWKPFINGTQNFIGSYLR